MRALALITAGALVLVLAAALGPAALAGDEPSGNGVSRADLVGVNFIENCRFSHQAPDDPIVFPGKPGASHQHTFVGNRTTSAFSSFGSLRSGSTTCMRAGRHRRLLGADALPGNDAGLPAGRDHLLPPRHDSPSSWPSRTTSA